MKITRENIAQHLVEYQLKLVGSSLEHSAKNHNWRKLYSMDSGQYIGFKLYAVPLIKKTFKCNKVKAENTFSWFMTQFGLKLQ